MVFSTVLGNICHQKRHSVALFLPYTPFFFFLYLQLHVDVCANTSVDLVASEHVDGRSVRSITRIRQVDGRKRICLMKAETLRKERAASAGFKKSIWTVRQREGRERKGRKTLFLSQV